MPSKAKHPRVGDILKIVTPTEFIRCGYPLTHAILKETRAQEIFPIADKLYAQLYNHPIPEPSLVDGGALGTLNINASNLYDKDQRVYSHLVSAVCSKLIADLHWGGKERQIFESPIEPYRLRAPLGWRVEFKRFVKTGTRFPSRSYQSYEGEYDWEPGGLDNEQTHCILTLYNLSSQSALLTAPKLANPSLKSAYTSSISSTNNPKEKALSELAAQVRRLQGSLECLPPLYHSSLRERKRPNPNPPQPTPPNSSQLSKTSTVASA